MYFSFLIQPFPVYTAGRAMTSISYTILINEKAKMKQPHKFWNNRHADSSTATNNTIWKSSSWVETT